MKHAVILSLMILLACGSSWAASPSPDGTSLAFSFIGDPEDIFLARADGSEARRWVDLEGGAFRPEWFPNGRSLLFTSAVEGGPQLLRLDLNSGTTSELTPVEWHASDGDPSPDGRHVVFFQDYDEGFDLKVLDLMTGEQVALTETPEIMEYAPRYAPDGARIVFVSRERRGVPPDIWTLDLEDGTRKNLTGTPEGDEFHPAWSPDGTRVAFVRVVEGEFAIHVLTLETGKDVQVAHEAGVACFSPHFTPDGEWVTFTRNVFEGSREGLPAVFRVHPDGTGLERLTGVPK